MKDSGIGQQGALPSRSGGGQSFAIFGAAIGVAVLAGILENAVGPFLAVALPLVAVLLVMALRDLRLSAGLLVLVLPLASTYLVPRQLLGLPGVNPLNALLLVCTGALFLTWVLRPRLLAVPGWPRPFFMYLAVLLGAAVHGAFSASSIPDYFQALKVITSNTAGSYLHETILKPAVTLSAVFIVSIAVRNAARPSVYLVPLFASATVFPFAIFFFVVTSGQPLSEIGSQDSRGYLSGLGVHANELGLLLNMACALALFSFLHTRRLGAKLMLGAVTFVLAAGALLTFSRGAYLGSLALLGYLLFVQRRFLLFVLALLLLPLAALLMPQPVAERATQGLGSNDVDAVSSGRVGEIWQPLLPEIVKSPLVGSGLGSILWSDAAQRRKILPVSHPHSAYLGSLLDVGLLGTIVVLMFYRHMWRLFTRLARSASEPVWRGFFQGAAAAILLLFVQGLTDDSFMPTRSQSFLWIAYGMAVGYASRQKAMADPAHRGPGHMSTPPVAKA